MAASLSRLLRPRHIAVFGGGWARQVARGCRDCGFQGALWPVHPRRKTIAGMRCFSSIAALPSAPDAAFVAVNAKASVEVVGELAAHGAGGAVCFASGFAEVGKRGAAMQKALVKAAGAMPFFGPNCYGFLNYLNGALLWPDQHGGARVKKGVAIISQSGNIAVNLAAQHRGLRVAALITLGNQAAVGFAETIFALLADPRISAIGMIMESASPAAALAKAAIAARKQKTPLLVLKLGTSGGGAQAAQSHTASLAGDDEAADAFFRRYAIARAPTLPAFAESLKLLDCGGALGGRTILSMSCSGGEAALLADACEKKRLTLRRLSTPARRRLRKILGDKVALRNPLDYHTFIWNDERKLAQAYRAALADAYDLALLILDFPRADRCADSAWRACVRAFVKAQKQTGARAALLATLPENLPEDVINTCARKGVAALCGIDDALAAAEAAAAVGEFHRRSVPPPLLLKIPARNFIRKKAIDEAAAKKILAAAGVKTPLGEVANEKTAAAAARRVGFPAAVKALGVVHKTDSGAVVLNCRDAADVKRAVLSIRKKNPRTRSFLVEEMISREGAVELIVGARTDSQFGLLIVVGFGGELAEIYRDTAALLPPPSKAEIKAALLSLRGAALLRGFRGRKKTLAAAVNGAFRIASFAAKARPAELDINPLIVRPDGAAFAADALLITGDD